MRRKCKCGHAHAYHVDPDTGIVGECIFSYNCDCKEFIENGRSGGDRRSFDYGVVIPERRNSNRREE